MKKIILTALCVLAVFSNSAAMELNDYKVFNKLNNEKTVQSLANYLKTDEAQTENLKYLFELTEQKVNTALAKGSEEAAEKALFFNLGNVKYLLSAEQYKKYLIVLNLTVSGNENLLVAEN
jgi:hypothetical protein